jgi:hypothetical protein
MITRLKLSTIEQGLPKYRSMLAGNDAYIPTAFESIASANGNGSASTITFSSIPGTYQHLQIRVFANDATGNNIRLRINGDTGTNYTYHGIRGDGSTVDAVAGTSQSSNWVAGYAGYTTNMFTVAVIDIHDYASTTKNKTVRSFAGYDQNGAGFSQLWSGLWLSTSAITSISLLNTGSANYVTNSTFALYGIKGA